MPSTGGRRRPRAPARRAGSRRLAGVEIKPGSVKQARLEAGLSLAKVAAGHVSAPAIYLIEVGRSRPSLPTLEHIARRTGKPVEYFLAERTNGDATQDGLLQLEDLIAHERFGEAVKAGEKLLKLATSANRLGNIRYLVAMARLRLGQPALATNLLREAHAHFEAAGDKVMLAECLGSEAAAAYLTQKPDALELAEQALATCRSLQHAPPLTEARLLGILASAHTMRQEWSKAVEFYEQAIEAAGSLYDLERLAKMYSGLSSSFRNLGQLDAAAKYVARSVALLEVLHDRVSLARAENELGLILMARGDGPAAHEHLERSLQLATETNLEVGRSNFLLSLCELSVHESNPGHAKDLARQALALAERLGEAANIAEAHMWLGRLAAAEGDAEVTDLEFGLAIRKLTEGGFHERLVRCNGIYAEVLEKRGEIDKAYEHMKKALVGSRPSLLTGGLAAADTARSA